MQFIFKEDYLEIKLSWKERIYVFFTGTINLHKKSIYTMSTVLMKIIHEMIAKYGDGKVHGTIEDPTSVDNSSKTN